MKVYDAIEEGDVQSRHNQKCESDHTVDLGQRDENNEIDVEV